MTTLPIPPYILDTDTFSLLQRGNPAILKRVLATPPADLGITAITVEEQMTGRMARLRQIKTNEDAAEAYRHLTETAEAFRLARLVTYDVVSMERFARLQSLKLNGGKMDLRIAAIALTHGVTVVTCNRRDFERVPGLMIEDWSA